MRSILECSAVELARQIRSGELSSVAAVSAHIRHIKAVNPVLNAMVQDRFDTALKEAAEADERIRSADPSTTLPPFLGVPCSIKECFAVEGMPNTAGVVARVGTVADADAAAVRNMRKAGFVIMGVSNTSELCIWMESYNKVYGRTNNPYDLARTAGGSSGGEGALVGVGASPVGLGSDVGGSIRMPAFFNGVFGHKCSSYLVPNDGQFPNTEGNGVRFLSTGPLCRKAEDLMPVLRVMAGDKGEAVGDPEEISLQGLKVYTLSKKSLPRTSAALMKSQSEAVDALVREGAVHEEIEILNFRKSVEIWSSMMFEDNETSFGDMILSEERFALPKQIASWFVGQSEHTFATLMTLVGEWIIPLVPWEDMGENVLAGNAIRKQLDELLHGNTILLHPSHGSTALRHKWALLPPFQWANTAIFNVLELPVTQVPLGLSSNGIPQGVQVVGAHGADHRTIGVACHLERLFGGWTPPELMKSHQGHERERE